MRSSHVVLLAAQLLAASAVALPHKGGRGGDVENAAGGEAQAGGDASAGAGAGKGADAGAGAGAGGAAEGEEGEGNEVNQDGQFDTAIELGGGDVKTDTLFPPGVSQLSQCGQNNHG